MASVKTKKISSSFLGSVNLSAFRTLGDEDRQKICDRSMETHDAGDINVNDVISYAYIGTNGQTNLRALVAGNYNRFFIVNDQYVLLTAESTSNKSRRIDSVVDLETGSLWDIAADSASSWDQSADAFEDVEAWINELSNHLPTAIIVPKAKGGVIVLRTGDDTGTDDSGYYDSMERVSVPYLKTSTISIRCLTRMVSDTDQADDINSLNDALESGIEVVALTEEEQRPASAAINAKYVAFKASTGKTWQAFMTEFTAPAAGFVLRQWDNKVEWHRSPYLVINAKNIDGSLLFGVDESSYFCCELPTRVKSVQAAFDKLVPTSIQKISGVMRQGEWFAVPVDTKKVPTLEKCEMLIGGCADEFDGDGINHENGDTPDNYSGFALPVEDATSARHIVSSPEEIRVYAGKVYALSPTVSHSRNEHAELVGLDNQWYTFVRNTAVRSVGEANVD